MGKMYYSEQEAAEKLGVTAEQLAAYVSKQQLRVFQDGADKMFRADEVAELAQAGVDDSMGGHEISLSPANDTSSGTRLSLDDTSRHPANATGSGTRLSLDDTSRPPANAKDDTVITAEGISIFDDEDLELEAVDPMAKTQITLGMEDQAAIEGAGGGSGLLDLTQESDDTSLGEVLDHIGMDGGQRTSSKYYR